MSASPAMNTTSTPFEERDGKNLAVLLHLGTLIAAVFTAGFLDVIVPAVAFFLFRHKGELLREHIRHQLNFQLTCLCVSGVCMFLTWATGGLAAIVTVPVMLFFLVLDVVCTIRAALAASRGDDYKFPFALSFVS